LTHEIFVGESPRGTKESLAHRTASAYYYPLDRREHGSSCSRTANPNPQPVEAKMAGMKEFANLFYREGALDPKTAQLVALAAMAAAGCTS
jgi:hypothetical protein